MQKDERISVIGMLAIVSVVFLLITLKPSVPTYQAKTFASYQELSDFLNERSESQYYGGTFMDARATGELAVAPTAAPGESTGTAKATDYSTTNIQVEGVDEPDIVKNDGKYIYTISSNNITIVDAYPAEGMKISSRISVDGTISNIFVNGDKLIVFGNNYNYWGGPYAIDESVVKAEAGISISGMVAPRYYSHPNSFIYVYNIADRANPVLVRNLTLDGSYYDARMIGGYVYAIIQQPVQMLDNGPVLPLMSVGSQAREIAASDITYFDEYDTSFTYTFVIALNSQNDAEQPTEKVFLLGYSQNLYVSQDNIYTVYTKYLSQTEQNRRLIEAIIPNLPMELQSKVNVVWNGHDMTSYEKMNAIGTLMQDYTESLGPEGGARFMQSLEQKMQSVVIELQKDMEKTVIHKIAVSGPSVEYRISGEVPGRVLNQFSMDEYNGNFRIATTTGNSWDQSSMNNMYVLDSGLGITGRLENLAQGEQIYSVRFMGERAYMVTFHRTDPLFVIDLSNPSSPAVLGELKMPGFSDYLHPVDVNHLIGVGQMADENGRLTGQVKLSLFDVSDVAHPIETSGYLIGGNGDWAYSEVLNDHKAFLFSSAKGLLAIPVSINNWQANRYFQGAYVFDFSVENGFNLKGTVTHQITNASEEQTYYDYQGAVRRSLYMDNVFYTISDTMIKASSLTDLGEIAKTVLQEPNTGIIYPVVY
ncbi:MAG: beta-propeller domain-containing protein [Candidatus Aenigmatarchaeota archaeon]